VVNLGSNPILVTLQALIFDLVGYFLASKSGVLDFDAILHGTVSYSFYRQSDLAARQFLDCRRPTNSFYESELSKADR